MRHTLYSSFTGMLYDQSSDSDSTIHTFWYNVLYLHLFISLDTINMSFQNSPINKPNWIGDRGKTCCNNAWEPCRFGNEVFSQNRWPYLQMSLFGVNIMIFCCWACLSSTITCILGHNISKHAWSGGFMNSILRFSPVASRMQCVSVWQQSCKVPVVSIFPSLEWSFISLY